MARILISDSSSNIGVSPIVCQEKLIMKNSFESSKDSQKRPQKKNSQTLYKRSLSRQSSKTSGKIDPSDDVTNSTQALSIDPNLIRINSQESDDKKVYEIDLHGHKISAIDSNLKYFSNVKILDLSCNHILKIQNLHFCKFIKELKLYDNQIENIVNLEMLKDLCQLQLQHNRISQIGPDLNNCKKLQSLRLDSNLLSSIESREICSLSQLSYLDISNNSVEDIKFLLFLPNIEEFVCVNNKVHHIPDLTNCKKLQEINISNNNLKELSGLKSVLNLRAMSASHNKISSLSSFSKMKNLLELDLSHNYLTDLSFIPKNFVELEILDLTQNQIQTWDRIVVLFKLKKLVELFVSENPFCQDDGHTFYYKNEVMDNMPHLQYLDGVSLNITDSSKNIPLMRPLTASSVVSARQVQSQLKSFKVQMENHEKDLNAKFANLRSSFSCISTESPSPSNINGNIESSLDCDCSKNDKGFVSKPMTFSPVAQDSVPSSHPNDCLNTSQASNIRPVSRQNMRTRLQEAKFYADQIQP